MPGASSASTAARNRPRPAASRRGGERSWTLSAPTITPTASSAQTATATRSAGGRSPSPSGSSAARACCRDRSGAAPARRALSGHRPLRRSAAVRVEPLAQRARGRSRIAGAGDRPQHAHPRRARAEHVREVARVEAADREERHRGVGGRVADELEPDGRAARLGRRLVDRADADVVDQARRRPRRSRSGAWVERPTSMSGPTSSRTSATGMSSWPTWTPSAPASRATHGRSLTISSAPSRSHSARAASRDDGELLVGAGASRAAARCPRRPRPRRAAASGSSRRLRLARRTPGTAARRPGARGAVTPGAARSLTLGAHPSSAGSLAGRRSRPAAVAG